MIKIKGSGKDKLWNWFGLTRSSFITLPRVMCHHMSDDWQSRMADLMEEWDNTWVNQPSLGTTVRITDLNGKLVKTPDWLLNYRHPDIHLLESMKENPYA